MSPINGIYVTSLFNISLGQQTHKVDQFVAPQQGLDGVGNEYLEGSSWTRSTVSSPYVMKISRWLMVGVGPWRQLNLVSQVWGQSLRLGTCASWRGQLCPRTAYTGWIKIQEVPVEAVMDIGVEVSFPKEVYDKLNCIPDVSAVLSHFIIDKNLSEYRYMIISGIARLLDFLLMPHTDHGKRMLSWGKGKS